MRCDMRDHYLFKMHCMDEGEGDDEGDENDDFDDEWEDDEEE
ncbi:MAG: hypothetical protein WC588_01565 [Candidatus Micrarchaeia archaeon]